MANHNVPQLQPLQYTSNTPNTFGMISPSLFAFDTKYSKTTKSCQKYTTTTLFFKTLVQLSGKRKKRNWKNCVKNSKVLPRNQTLRRRRRKIWKQRLFLKIIRHPPKYNSTTRRERCTREEQEKLKWYREEHLRQERTQLMNR